MSTSKPLSTSLGEALASKSSEHPTLLSRPSPPSARPLPPSSRPSRIPVYAAEPTKQLHALPPPEGPDRSLVANDEGGERKKRKRRVTGTPEMKAEAVRRSLAGETHTAVGEDLGVSASAVSLWVREAKAAAAKETAKKFEANDISRVSQELAEAINLQKAAAERVKVLKAKLRELLGDE